jgi:cell division protein FtsA
MPVRVAGPTGVGGLTDNIMNPAYSTAIGLLYWGAKNLDSGEIERFPSAPAGGLPARVRDALRNLFP